MFKNFHNSLNNLENQYSVHSSNLCLCGRNIFTTTEAAFFALFYFSQISTSLFVCLLNVCVESITRLGMSLNVTKSVTMIYKPYKTARLCSLFIS